MALGSSAQLRNPANGAEQIRLFRKIRAIRVKQFAVLPRVSYGRIVARRFINASISSISRGTIEIRSNPLSVMM